MAVVPQETHLAFDYTVARSRPHGTLSAPARLRDRGSDRTSRSRARRWRPPARSRSQDRRSRRSAAARSSASSSPPRWRRFADAARPAVIGPHPVLLLDEPTAALDLAYQLELAALLRDLQARIPMAIVVSTHDLNFAAGLVPDARAPRGGRVLASGPTADVLTPPTSARSTASRPRSQRHASGRLVIVPLSRTARGPGVTTRSAGGGENVRSSACSPSARSSWRRSSARPPSTCGAHSTSHPVRRQRRRADLLHRAAAAHARGRARRRDARVSGRRLPGAAAQPARDAVHARRVGRRGARRDAGDHVRLDVRVGGIPAVPAASFVGPSSPSRSSTPWRGRVTAGSRPTCCCSPASR